VKLEVDRAPRGATIAGGVTEDEGVSVDSHSLPLSFSFCFAAFTLALERTALVSAEDILDDDDCGSWSWIGERENELELLVASC
jgi:hypothetical protein